MRDESSDPQKMSALDSAVLQEQIRRKASQRLLSLDALRGLNMLCIIGLATLIAQCCALHSSDFRVFGEGAVKAASSFRQHWFGPSPEAISKQMDHVTWNGVRHHDTIFPLFLFLAGVSFPFSLNKQRANGRPTWRICLKVLWRGFALVLVGIIYSNKVVFDFENLRFMGVLQHIGLAWMIAAFIYMAIPKMIKTQIGICAGILVLYWLFVTLVPAHDVAPDEAFTAKAFQDRAATLFTPRPTLLFDENPLPDPDSEDYPAVGTIEHNLLPEGCVVNFVDRQFVPGKLYHDHENARKQMRDGEMETTFVPSVYRKMRDPEGLASTFPAIVTALLGMMAGALLRREDSVCPRWLKFAILAAAGVVLLGIGYAWHLVFPINKNLWNSSFVCFVGGYSALALAIFYLLIDVLRMRWIGWPFAIVGMNSITIFLAKRIVDFTNMRDFFFYDAIHRFIPHEIPDPDVVDGVIAINNFQSIATTCAGLLVSWLFLFWLYKKKIFMRL